MAALEAIIAEGIAGGTLRPLADPRILANGLMGTVSWTHRWFNPLHSSTDAAAIGEAYADLLLGGLVRAADDTRRPADMPPAALAATARDTGLGEVLPGDEHVLVEADAVRRLAAGRVGPAWDAEFKGMLVYAARKGWVDESGTRVRAHIACK